MKRAKETVQWLDRGRISRFCYLLFIGTISSSQLMLYFTIPCLFCLQYAILFLVFRWILGSNWHLGLLFKLVFNKLWLNKFPAAATAKSFQSCPTLCDPIDGSPPGFSIPGILQARTLEWVAISFSSAWKWKVKVKSLSCVLTPWTAAHQAPLSMGFSRQEYWSGMPLPSPE